MIVVLLEPPAKGGNLVAGSKNNPENRKTAQSSKVKMSADCEACATKCPAGTAYLESLNSSTKRVRIGKGVVCSL